MELVHQALGQEGGRKGSAPLHKHPAHPEGGQFVEQMTQAAPPSLRREMQVLYAPERCWIPGDGPVGRLPRNRQPDPGPGGDLSSLVHDHLRTAPEVKARLGITDGLLRFSVGIEDQPDLIADLEKGFQAAAAAR